MSETERFVTMDDNWLEVVDTKKQEVWCRAATGARGEMIAKALNRHTRALADERRGEPSEHDECAYQAIQGPHRVVRHSYDYSGLEVYRVMGPDGDRIMATCEEIADAKLICDLLDAAAKRTEQKPPTTTANPFRECVGAYRAWESLPDDPYHVYGSHDLVNQTFCYKVRRRDAEGVEYLVAQFDTVDAAIKERDRLNAEAKAKPNPQASTAPTNWYSIAGVVNANSKSVKFCVNCQTPDGRFFTVSEWDKREDALAECDRLNAKERAQPQPTTSDPVDAPDHYRQGEIECIDAVKSMLGAEGFAYWLRGNMVAYLWRLPHKGEAVKDAGKTRNLAERLERLLGG